MEIAATSYMSLPC